MRNEDWLEDSSVYQLWGARWRRLLLLCLASKRIWTARGESDARSPLARRRAAMLERRKKRLYSDLTQNFAARMTREVGRAPRAVA